MSAILLDGHRWWEVQRQEDGHRRYTVRHYVQVETTEGPATALACADLPQPGDAWLFDSDSDQWAFCTNEAKVMPVYPEGNPNKCFSVEQYFTTNPSQRCGDTQVDDPLLEPDIITIDFSRMTEEATTDLAGNPILTSSHELVRGAQVEFDASKISVSVEQNSPTSGLEVWGPMVNTVNDAPLWGLGPRTIKLSTANAKQVFYGQCQSYWKRSFSFDVDAKILGFDRSLLDEGNMVLNGHWGTGEGSGCTVTTECTDGGIDDITNINSGGTGYPKNATIRLVVFAGNSDGAFEAKTSATGVVTSIVRITSRGTGYVSGAAEATLTEAGWVLDDINGLPPDPANPNHFIRFKDRAGENSRVVLDGRGSPYDPFVDRQARTIVPTLSPASLANANEARIGRTYGVNTTTEAPLRLIAAAANDNTFRNHNYYKVRIEGKTLRIVLIYDRGEQIDPGRLRIKAYATASITGLSLGETQNVEGGTQMALTITSGEEFAWFGFILNEDIGFNVGYSFRVEGPPVTGPGRIFVQKYPQSNFLQLGIPALLG